MTEAVVARKVAEIRARVARVRELLPGSAEDLRARRTEAEALVLNLLVAIQASSDLALHVVAARGLGVPADARQAFELLARAGIVDVGLAERLARAVGLRNRIAHAYGTLDLGIVHGVARDDLGDLERLAAAVARAQGL